MSSVEVPNDRAEGIPFRNPWPALATGLAATAVAAAWFTLLGDWAVLPRIGVLVIGLLATGAAVAIRPGSPLILGLSGLAGLLGTQGMSPAWDSLNADQKRLYAHMMEVFAAYGAHCDYHMGRIVDAVKQMPGTDNTI